MSCIQLICTRQQLWLEIKIIGFISQSVCEFSESDSWLSCKVKTIATTATVILIHYRVACCCVEKFADAQIAANGFVVNEMLLKCACHFLCVFRSVVCCFLSFPLFFVVVQVKLFSALSFVTFIVVVLLLVLFFGTIVSRKVALTAEKWNVSAPCRHTHTHTRAP